MTDGWLEAEARAKVNLGLRIFPRGPDGYHPIETVFCRIDRADRVRLRLRDEPGVAIRVGGPERAPEGPDNLASRAAALFLERSATTAGVEIELEKRVPAGAGLGGGSSDAAAVLRLLSRAVSSPPGRAELLGLAAELGADVTFFAADTPLAFAWGRGQRMLACPGLEPRPMVLLVPAVSISTAEAYAHWDERGGEPRPPGEPLLRSCSDLADWKAIGSAAVNDFEPVIFGLRPDLRILSDRLSETEPTLALLSGSGSALFAVYESERQRDEAAVRLGALEEARVISARGPA